MLNNLKKVMQYVEYGKQDGATLRYGGERFYPDGTDGKATTPADHLHECEQ